jgi:CDP-diacylglycerol--glycerol-3-phosphate 3-phosphatidyltransferase
MSSPVGNFIVGGRFMRAFYAVVKACAFSGLALLQPFPVVLPTLWGEIGWLLTGLTYSFVYLAVLLCVIRGVPVIAEFVYAQKSDILRRAGVK